MDELQALKKVLLNAIQKMENDKTKIVNAIEYIKIETAMNTINEIIAYVDSRIELLEKESLKKVEKKA